MRAVLVGCGNLGKVWLDCLDRIGGTEIVGLCDVDFDRAEELRAARGLESKVSNSYDSLLAELKPEVVFDTVVPAGRFEIVSKALAAGCHVLSEKPMAESLDDARRLVEMAHKSGKIHAIIQNRRYLAVPRRIRAFLDSGALGHLTGIYCDFFLGPHFGGFREEMDHVLLLDMAIHTFDSARQMSGLDAQAVYCQEWNPANSWFSHGASAVALFEMDGGVVFNYRGSWCAEGLPTSWESAWRFTCEKGTLLWDGTDDLRAGRVVAPNGFFSEVESLNLPPLQPEDRIGGHEGVIREFLEAVETGSRPETAGSENIKSLAMVFGAIESASKRQRVEVSVWPRGLFG